MTVEGQRINTVQQMEGTLHPLFLGFNAAELWDTIGYVFLSYGLMTFAPRWKYTADLALMIPFFHSMVYVSGVILLAMNENHEDEGDFFSLDGVIKIFQDPNNVFVGWVHYVVFDCLVARMILLDSIQRGASWTVHFLLVVPCMFLTLMLGPTGFLSYMVLRLVVLPIEESKKSEYEKIKVL